MNPKGAPLVFIFIFKGVAYLLNCPLHILVDNVLLPHIGMAGFRINIYH
jgi:hypothetical protein